MKVTNTTKDINLDVLYADGTRKQIALRPEAFDFAKQFFAPMLSSLTFGCGIRSLIENVPNIVAISRSDHDILHQSDHSRQQAIFRLGQMNMRASIADALLSMADGTWGVIRSTLIDAAELVRKMEVLHGDS